MDDWALVVNRDPELREFVAETVEKAFASSLAVVARSNLEEGERVLQSRGLRSCKLVVAGVTAPLSRHHSPPLDASDLTALEFARRVRQGGDETLPFVFLVAFNDLGRLEEQAKIANVCTVECGSDFYRRLPGAIAALVRPGARGRTGLPYINVDITLTDNATTWQLRARGALNSADDGGPLNIRDAVLDNLIRRSEVETPDPTHLGQIGTRLFDMLMLNTLNKQLYASLNKALGMLSGEGQRFRDLELARIRFIVDQRTHPILLETIAPGAKGSEPDFWMLKAPIFRKYEQRADQYPLFKDKKSRYEPFDCLLIQACARPFVSPDPMARRFQSIPLAGDEVACLETLLGSLKQHDPR